MADTAVDDVAEVLSPPRLVKAGATLTLVDRSLVLLQRTNPALDNGPRR